MYFLQINSISCEPTHGAKIPAECIPGIGPITPEQSDDGNANAALIRAGQIPRLTETIRDGQFLCQHSMR